MREEIETCGCMPQTAYVLLLYKLMPQYYIAVLFVRHSLTLHNLDVTVHGPTFLHSNLVSSSGVIVVRMRSICIYTLKERWLISIYIHQFMYIYMWCDVSPGLHQWNWGFSLPPTTPAWVWNYIYTVWIFHYSK